MAMRDLSALSSRVCAGTEPVSKWGRDISSLKEPGSVCGVQLPAVLQLCLSPVPAAFPWCLRSSSSPGAHLHPGELPDLALLSFNPALGPAPPAGENGLVVNPPGVHRKSTNSLRDSAFPGSSV